jgi:putative ABC transport system permease protein
VLKEQGSTMGTNSDNNILIPITTAKYLGSDTSITNFYAKVENEAYIDQTIRIIENYIRSNLQIGSDYYTVSSQTSMLDAMENINNTLTLLLAGIASISLIVGGIGVMNVMLVSVTERTKEIGIRKSLGAKKIDILIQFLIEALVLSIIGGILGIGFGILIGSISSQFGYTFVYSIKIMIIAFSSSAAIGLVFGIFPAYRAAKLNPIDALRQE